MQELLQTARVLSTKGGLAMWMSVYRSVQFKLGADDYQIIKLKFRRIIISEY